MKYQPINQSSGSIPSARKIALAWSATDSVPAMLKIAFATDDRQTVNQHFGAAAGFAIYALDAERAHLIEVAEYPPATMDGNEDKLADKIAALTGCTAVYCLAAGGSAVRQLLAGGIQPVRVSEEEEIESLLNHLRQAIREGGIGWLDKKLQQVQVREAAEPTHDGSRFDRMAEEGWQE